MASQFPPESPLPPVPPTPPPSAATSSKQPLWLLLALAGVLLVLLPLCCCGGCFLVGSQAGSGSQIVGRWKGPWDVPKGALFQEAFKGADIDVEIEFKRSGRFELSGWAATQSGGWKVRDTEGNKLLLEIFYDEEPRKVLGWTVVVNSPDQIDLSIETTHMFKLVRQ